MVKVNQKCNIMGKVWCGSRPLGILGRRLDGEKTSTITV